MNTSFHKPLLRFAHLVLYAYLVGACLVGLFLLVRSVTALSPGQHDGLADGPGSTVTIRLDTSRPRQLTLLGDAITGFEDGASGRPEPSAYRIPTPYSSRLSGYELHPNRYQQLLRYPEPNPWKRLLLLQLGFTDTYLSFQLFAFLLISSLLLVLITRNVRRHGAFTSANARYIWWLGLLLIGSDAYQVFAYWLVRFVVPPFKAAGLAAPLNRYALLNNTLEYGGWVAGMMLLIIALVYRQGVKLHQEAELTV